MGVRGRQALTACPSLYLGFGEVNAQCESENIKGVFCAQQLQEKAVKVEELWASVDKSYQSLVKTLHHGTAQALHDQMEGGRKRSVA